MKPRSVLLWFSLFLHLLATAQTPQEKTHRFLKQKMQQDHIPGLAYAVVKDGAVLAKGVMGNASIPFNQKVTTETVFQLASASKIFCALLLGKLFDQHLLRPDQTLGELIDSVPGAWKNITVLQLAAHQSGIRMADMTNLQTSRDIVLAAQKLPMEYEPGTKAAYVSTDYWILVYLIEKVTHQRYYDALKKYVLQPLGLRHTFVSNPQTGMITSMDIVPQQAQEYHWHSEDSTLRISQMFFPSTAYGAGGIYSSIEDLITVAQCFDKGAFLSAATRQLIATPHMFKDGKPGPFGLSLHIDLNYQGHKLVEHSGGPALADFVRFEDEKTTVIVLTNNRGVFPYLAKSVATFYIPGLKMFEVPKDWR